MLRGDLGLDTAQSPAEETMAFALASVKRSPRTSRSIALLLARKWGSSSASSTPT